MHGGTAWSIMRVVSKCLKGHGLHKQAREFRRRAFELDFDDEDTTEMLALAIEYVVIL